MTCTQEARHFYAMAATFTRLGKVPTLRALGKRAEVTDQVERLDRDLKWLSDRCQHTPRCFDKLRRAFPFAQAAIERKRHYGEPMRWAIK